MKNYDWEESRNCLLMCKYYDVNNDECSREICKKLEK